MKVIAALLGLMLLAPGILYAQEAEKTSTEARLKALEDRIVALEAEVRTLKAEQAAAPAAPAPAAPVPAAPAPVAAVPTAAAQGVQLPVYGGAAAQSKILNPDISAIGDFIGSVGKNPIAPVPSLEFHEGELGFQAIVDPYARGDVFISFGEEGVEIEEAYLTFTGVRGGFVPKVGKMRAEFGKVNTIHNHALPWIDRPMVWDNLVNGEDGIDDAGLSVSRILPAPGDFFLEGTAQVFRGDSGDLFTAGRKQDVSVVGHLRGYKDLSDSTNLDLGFSYARGHNDEGSDFLTQLYGADVTLRWKPLRRAIYHSFLARAEFVWSHRDEPLATQRAFGFYTSADYRLNRRWTIGGRFDRTGRARAADMTDTGFSAILTYWPSEFSQVRGQYRFARYAEGLDANELRFQFLFVLGAHGAHPF